NPELQIYKCFGCGVGGDLIDFVERIEGLDFPQALELLAGRAGIDLAKYSSPSQSKLRDLKKRALEAHRLAAEYYHYILLKHPSGAQGKKYALEKRKLKIKQIEDFKLGFAPENFHNL